MLYSKYSYVASYSYNNVALTAQFPKHNFKLTILYNIQFKSHYGENNIARKFNAQNMGKENDIIKH